MKPFNKLTARSASLPMVNVDTDMIIPKQFLKTIKRTGLGVNAFDEMRYDNDGNEISSFVLNQAPFRSAEILVAGENFGCGSSREHAPWAILDFGIRCIIASSFADIFYNNCFKNGILPVKLDEDKVQILHQVSQEEDNQITIDLESQSIEAEGETYSFEIDPFRKHCLINGLDDIGLTLEKAEDISSYEAKMKSETPWLWSA